MTTAAPSALAPAPGRRPEWLKIRAGGGPGFVAVKEVVRSQGLHTVCEEARCPNIGECWALGTATFMILGSVCTRNCGFCAIDTGRPPITDLDEPRRVAEATKLMNLKHVVVTLGGSVVRVNPSTHLVGEGADAELYGLYFADTGQHLDQDLPERRVDDQPGRQVGQRVPRGRSQAPTASRGGDGRGCRPRSPGTRGPRR